MHVSCRSRETGNFHLPISYFLFSHNILFSRSPVSLHRRCLATTPDFRYAYVCQFLKIKARTDTYMSSKREKLVAISLCKCVISCSALKPLHCFQLCWIISNVCGFCITRCVTRDLVGQVVTGVKHHNMISQDKYVFARLKNHI